MEDNEPPQKKIKLIEAEEDILVEEDVHMEEDFVHMEEVVLSEEKDEDEVPIIIDDWEKEEEEEVAYINGFPFYINNISGEEYAAFMIELLQLHDEEELIRVLVEAEEEEEEAEE
ncbi:hypothetical protein ALC57_16950 [Trachymyrmex cornetzi]|uniref:Uncharacterized protein n=1 Tax=Trachymyrmex cornetzi TaxID=471704 RepID=A0A151IU66_9HYME|nr:hypothetical protein ALC57_16950 [Trachymyrmex cornetzi]